MNQKSFAPLAVLYLTVLAFPMTVQSQDFAYITNNGTITITRYTGSGGAVTIPDTIDGLVVTSIGDYAFQYAAPTTVKMPDTLTSIGYKAFAECRSLVEVNIPNPVSHISAWAFYGCTSLTNVSLPSSITFIPDYGFFACTRNRLNTRPQETCNNKNGAASEVRCYQWPQSWRVEV